jgi:hypothetical protein
MVTGVVPPALVVPAIDCVPAVLSLVPPALVVPPAPTPGSVPAALPLLVLVVPAALLVPPVFPMRGVLFDGEAPHAAAATERPPRNPIRIVREDISFYSCEAPESAALKRNAAVRSRAARTTARNFRQFRVSVRTAVATFERALSPPVSGEGSTDLEFGSFARLSRAEGWHPSTFQVGKPRAVTEAYRDGH